MWNSSVFLLVCGCCCCCRWCSFGACAACWKLFYCLHKSSTGHEMPNLFCVCDLIFNLSLWYTHVSHTLNKVELTMTTTTTSKSHGSVCDRSIASQPFHWSVSCASERALFLQVNFAKAKTFNFYCGFLSSRTRNKGNRSILN